MNPNKITQHFFSAKKRNCDICNTKSSIDRTIQIISTTPLDDNYCTILIWNHQKENKRFKLSPDVGNLSPEMNEILSSNTDIFSIKDIENVCILLNKLGYAIDGIWLHIKCEICDNFEHKFYLEWSKPSKLLSLISQSVDIEDYVLANYYARNQSSVGYPGANGNRHYATYNYLSRLDFKKYKTLKAKIKQTILLG